MDLYHYDVYTLEDDYRTKNVRLQDIVDLNDQEVCANIANKVNAKKKEPAQSIDLLSSCVQVHYTSRRRSMLCNNYFAVAESKEEAIEHALLTSYLYECQWDNHRPGDRQVKCVRFNGGTYNDPFIQTIRCIKEQIKEDHFRWTNQYITSAKEKKKSMSNQVSTMIKMGLVVADLSVNRDEYDVQCALGQLHSLIKTMPLKINEAMVAFVGLSTNDIHQSVQQAIDAYHQVYKITCPSHTK